MYGLKELPDEVRKDFRLSGNPYDGNEVVLQELRELGIIRFLDDVSGHAVLIEPDDGGGKITSRRGFDGFIFRALVDADSYEPRQWVDDVRRSSAASDVYKRQTLTP